MNASNPPAISPTWLRNVISLGPTVFLFLLCIGHILKIEVHPVAWAVLAPLQWQIVNAVFGLPATPLVINWPNWNARKIEAEGKAA